MSTLIHYLFMVLFLLFRSNSWDERWIGMYQIVNKRLYNTNRDSNGYTRLINISYDKLCIFGTVSNSPFFLMTNNNNNKYLFCSDNFIQD